MATIRKRGSRWHAQVRRTGFPSQTNSFGSKVAAEAWARAIENKADEGDSEYLPKGRCKGTLKDLLERYAEEVSPRKRGRAEELIRLRTLLREPIARTPLRELTSVQLSAYRDKRLSQVSGETIRREFTLIRHCLKVARTEWGYPIPRSVTDRVALPAPNQPRERRLTASEVSALFLSGEKARNPSVLPMIRLALHTGLRRGELLALRGEDIDVERRTLLVRISKSGKARTIPLSLDALGVLRSLEKRPGERLFPMSANAFRLAWERIKARAGCEDLHFHDLRHEAISRFFEMGLTTPEVASISGHRDLRMLMRYSHPVRVRILEVLDRCNGSHPAV